MALSVIVIPGDGVTTQFNIPFALGYIKESDITARVGNEVDGTGNPVYRTLTFLSTEIVEVSGAPAAVGVDIVFRRTVDREQLIVDYEDGDIINEENMNTAQRQAIMLVHEVLDGRFEQFQSSFDMGGFKITGLGLPTDPNDAATKVYVDDRIATGQASANAAAASAASAANSANAAASSTVAAANSAAASEFWAAQAQLGFIPDGYITDPKIAKPSLVSARIDGDKIKYEDGIDPFPTPLVTRLRNWMLVTDTDQITGNGTSNDQTGFERAVEKAITQRKRLIVNDDINIRLTEPVTNIGGGGLKIKGGGVEITENNNYNANAQNTSGRGSWIFLDHAGIGFDFTGRANGSNTVGNSHFQIDGIGTYRNQPAPGPGWAPGNFDYDWVFTQCTADIPDLVMLNPTKGLDWRRGRAGQLNVGLLRGQPLKIGVHVQNAYDVVRFRDIHFWPFWSLDDDVMTYIRNSADAVQLARCDGPMFDNLFSFGYSRSVLFTNFAGNGVDEPGGTTYHGSFGNVYADLGGQAFAIGSEANGCTASFSRIIAEQSTAVTTDTPNVYVAGPNAGIAIGHITGNNARANVILNVGVSSKVLISMLEARIFNRSLSGFAALSAQASGAEVQIGEYMNNYTPNGAVMASEASGGRVSGLRRSGVATVPNGSSGIVVTHGLGVAPRKVKFEHADVGAQAAGANLPRWHTPTATQFTIDIGVVATAARNFSWEAIF